MSLRIDRCLCFDRPFADLREVADATGAQSVAELQQHAAFGRKCGLCHPYVRRMLRTGETVFSAVVTGVEEPSSRQEGGRRKEGTRPPPQYDPRGTDDPERDRA